MVNPAVVGALREAAAPLLQLLLGSQPVMALLTGLVRLVDAALARHRRQGAPPPAPDAGSPRS